MSVVQLQLVNLHNGCFTTASFAEQKCEIWITVQPPDLILSNMCTMCTNCVICFNKNSLCASAVDHETSERWVNVIICNETKKEKNESKLLT